MNRERSFEIIRTEWPALIRFDGKYFEEEYDIDVNEQKFREVSDEYAERMRSYGDMPMRRATPKEFRSGGVERTQTSADPSNE